MSGICGIVNFNKKPIDPEILKKMVGFIDYRGPDGITYWIDGNVGLVNLAFNTTPESLLEEQPLIDEDLVLTADARVDNRKELINSLKNKGYLNGKTHTDADLILAAYKCWEEECTKHIIGDFAFVIWDESKEKLFMARDTMGLRQLFYTFHENSLYFASALQPVVHSLPKIPSLNIQLMQDFLRRSFNLWPCQTIYNKVFRVPPAHSITAKSNHLNRKLYYVFGQEPKPDFSNDKEWIDGFYDLLDEILMNYMRSMDPVGIWVSGGLDSSALACQIYHLREKNQNLPEIKFISAVFNETPSADEKVYFDSVVNYCKGTPAKYVVSDNLWAFSELGTDDNFPLDEPEVWEMRGYSREVMKATRKEGCSVYFTGLGCDDLIGQAFYHIPLALRDVRLKDWFQESYWFKKIGKFGWAELLFKAYLLPFVPTNLVNKIVNHLTSHKTLWLDKNYKITDKNICKFPKEFFISKGLDNYGSKAYQMLRNPSMMSSFDFFGLMAFHNNLELRQPYFDRRIMEFLIKIPPHLRSFNGVTRVLLRKSMKAKMPESVRTRKNKKTPMELYYRGFHKEQEKIKDLFNNSKLEKIGLVDSKKLNNEFDRLLNKKYENFKYLAWYITLETWLRENYNP